MLPWSDCRSYSTHALPAGHTTRVLTAKEAAKSVTIATLEGKLLKATGDATAAARASAKEVDIVKSAVASKSKDVVALKGQLANATDAAATAAHAAAEDIAALTLMVSNKSAVISGLEGKFDILPCGRHGHGSQYPTWRPR